MIQKRKEVEEDHLVIETLMAMANPGILNIISHNPCSVFTEEPVDVFILVN
jgi:hypothetical protein